MERAITADEAAVVRWLLDHAPVGDVTAYRLQHVEELRVIGGCDCCSSLEFRPKGWGGAGIIADAWAVYSDGHRDDLILWGRDGEIVLLEVVNYHREASHGFPQISELRNFIGADPAAGE
jgi:hypothetical protein